MKLSVRTKLLGGFSVALLLAGVAAVAGIIQLSSVNSKTGDVAETSPSHLMSPERARAR